MPDLTWMEAHSKPWCRWCGSPIAVAPAFTCGKSECTGFDLTEQLRETGLAPVRHFVLKSRPYSILSITNA